MKDVFVMKICVTMGSSARLVQLIKVQCSSTITVNGKDLMMLDKVKLNMACESVLR